MAAAEASEWTPALGAAAVGALPVVGALALGVLALGAVEPAGACAHAAMDVCKTLTSVRLAIHGTRQSEDEDMWC
jgi:hypothetical protein